MTNDTSKLDGALMELGDTMADNLVAMGVSGASASDGLTTLANNILDIAPSVGGITPTVSIDLSKSPTLICRGATVDIMALVHADYDDTSQTDVDLKGYLQGATVTFKNGNTGIGYAVSDNDGIATLTINDIAMGNYSIVGSFDGTGTDYESATSSALTFTVNDYPTITLSADKTSVTVGETVTFTITAEYNNTPVVGYPIQLYKDGSSMGSSYSDITNSNGTCTITYTIGSSDTSMTINVNTLSNDINITVTSYDGITVTSNKNILSYYNTDTATLSAQLTKNGTSIAVSGVPITFKQGSTTLGTAVTDNTGLATLTDAYTSTGIGDISCTATTGNITSNSITIEDCYYFNDGTSVNGLEIDSGVSCTSNGTYITIQRSSNGEKYVYLPKTLTDSDNWLYEVEIADNGQVNPMTMILDYTDKWGNYTISENAYGFDLGNGNVIYNTLYNIGDIITVTRQNGVDTVTLNNSIQITQRTCTHKLSFKVGFYTNQNRVQNIKNIKLKPL